MATTKRRKRAGAKRPPPKGFRSWKEYMASIRPKRAGGGGARRAAPKKRRAAPAAAESAPRAKRRRRTTRTNNGGAAVATRKTTRRRVARAAAKTRRVYRRARATKTGELLIPMMIDGAKDGAAILAGRASTRIAPQLLKLDVDSIPGMAVGALAVLAGGLLMNNWGVNARRAFVGGGFAALAEAPIAAAGIPYVSGALGDPYGYGYDQLPGGYTTPAQLGDDLSELAGYLRGGEAQYYDEYPIDEYAQDHNFAGMI